MKHRLFSSLLISSILISQTTLGGVALADTASPSPSPTPEVSASPAPSAPESPAPATPEPPAPPTPAAPPTPTNPPGPADSRGAQDTGATNTGPTEPTGTIPDYVYDRAGQAWVPSDRDSFIYDKASGYWLSPKYTFNKRTGWYEIPVAGTTQEASDEILTAPEVVHTSMGDLVVGSPDWQLARLMGVIGPDGQPTGAAALSGTGSDSSNSTTINNDNQEWIDFTSLVNIINVLQSAAKSGDVEANANTTAGDAASGAAAVLANVINLLASAWSWSGGDLTFFMRNLFEDYNRDLVLDPGHTSSTGGGSMDGSVSTDGTGANSTNQGSVNNNNELTVNASSTANITNNVDVVAQSGDASANANTTAGDVRTGDAFAGVNIINLINSFINSGSSFFAILNIFGNLNGDILFPDGFLNGLFGGSGGDMNANIGNTGAGSNNSSSVSNDNQSNNSNSSQYGLDNNVNATAQSGSATADKNTTAGSASSGSASTTGSLFNMVNSSVFGDNAVLVIVNVMGRWVGRIMNLPGTGASTSALLLGNGQVSHNNTGAGSANQADVTNTNAADIQQTAGGTITNNVNVHAQSGDASAIANTEVGDVASGEAKAATSVTNIVNSALNVKHWFGVLVINVFGDWFGSVNENTEAGNAAGFSGGSGATQEAAPAASMAAAGGVLVAQAGKALGLPVGSVSDQSQGAQSGTSAAQRVADAAVAGGAVLGAAEGLPVAVAAAAKGAQLDWLMFISAALLLLSGAAFSLDRRLRPRRR